MLRSSKSWLAAAVAVATVFVAMPVATPGFLPGLAGSSPAAASPVGAGSGGGMTHVCGHKPLVVCGTFEAPLDRSDPGVGSVRIFFQRYIHTDHSKPALEPIVAVEGGPGFATIGSASWYVGLFAPLMGRRDLILMDLPGTGQSQAIDCRPLQAGNGSLLAEVGACGAQLGATANDWGSANAADDLSELLHLLGIATIDLYGDSYGTFFVQTFAVRHPDQLRTIVMDSAYPAYGIDPWGRDTNVALDAAYGYACSRDAWCAAQPGSLMSFLARLAAVVSRHPVTGTGYDADGHPHHIVGDLSSLLALLTDAATNLDVYREVYAAGLALMGASDPAPLLRLFAEDYPNGVNGPADEYSAGLYTAVACHDYPWMYDMTAPPGERLVQYRTAVASLASSDPGAFAPFTVSQWVGSGVEGFNYCLRWPARPTVDPPVPPNAVYPSVPTLVLSGDLDSLTSPAGAHTVASRFPRSTFVDVANTTHVTALGDLYGCASVIVRRFVTTDGWTGPTGCATRIPAVRMVVRFAARVADAVPAVPVPPADRSTPTDRKVAAVATETVADALARWANMTGSSGVGLRGGTFTEAGSAMMRFVLHGDRWAADLPVNGNVWWNQATGAVSARVSVRGGWLRMSWSNNVDGGLAAIDGVLDGRAIAVTMPTP